MQEASNRCAAQEAVWNAVWQRRIVYFLTVFSTIYLVAYPFIRAQPPSAEFSTRLTMIASAIRLLGNVLPGIASTWIDAYARDPSHFVFVGGIVAILIYLGSRLGTDIRSRMQVVWRQNRAIDQNAEYRKSLKSKIPLLLIPGAYALLHPWIPASQFLEPLHSWVDEYFTGPVRAVLFFLLLAYLLPPWMIYKLRTHPVYQGSIKFLKLEAAPALFAYGLAVVVLLFAAHYVFVVQETAGFVCHESPKILTARSRGGNALANSGVSSCKPASIATCDGDSPTCSVGRTLICSDHKAPTCIATGSKRENLKIPMCTYGPATCSPQCEDAFAVLQTNSVCNGTKLWLEEGSKYKLTVAQQPGDWTDGISVIDRWRDNLPADLRGYNIEDLDSGIDRLIAIVMWPLKRTWSQPMFRVTARIGASGSNEEFLIPEQISAERRTKYLKEFYSQRGANFTTAEIEDLNARDEALTIETTITPKISGELFLYVNDAALPGWGRFRSFFYRKNTGAAKVTVTLLPRNSP